MKGRVVSPAKQEIPPFPKIIKKGLKEGITPK